MYDIHNKNAFHFGAIRKRTYKNVPVILVTLCLHVTISKPLNRVSLNMLLERLTIYLPILALVKTTITESLCEGYMFLHAA
jgi:hypothetical protein